MIPEDEGIKEVSSVLLAFIVLYIVAQVLYGSAVSYNLLIRKRLYYMVSQNRGYDGQVEALFPLCLLRGKRVARLTVQITSLECCIVSNRQEDRTPLFTTGMSII